MQNCRIAANWVVFFTLSATLFAKSPPSTIAETFRGAKALAYTRQATAFGERPSGSEALVRTRAWILSELKPLGGQISLDSFTGQTPAGPIPMVNVIVTFPGSSGRSVVVTGHYDTKRIPMVRFVGANDGGSSTGFLIEFARAVSQSKHSYDLKIVFFDGEEALGEWSAIDSRYGSRHLAARWLMDGTLSRINALINIDMIGDKDLDLSNDRNSSEILRAKVKAIADRLGYGKFWRSEEGAIDDDHTPFGDAGVNVIDIIDLDYGPNGSYWHTAQDTMDKLSARSFQIVGDTIMALVQEVGQSQ